MITYRFGLENYFQEILYMIDIWVNNGSAGIVGSIESQYIKILTYRLLSGSSYMSLPVELRNKKKRTNQLQKQRSKMFLRCHVKHINPSKEHPERIRKTDKKTFLSILLIQKKLHKKIKSLLVILIMMELSFPCKKKILARLR